jgi:hypothetical protein
VSSNKYIKEPQVAENIRDGLILSQIVAIYDRIREKSFILSSKAKARAGDDTDYFNEKKRSKAFAKKVSKDLTPEYLKRDKLTRNVYAEEYRTTYFYAKYSVENQGIFKGFKFKLPRYTREQFQKALNYSMSVISDLPEMTRRRKQATKQVYNSIVGGIEQGLSIDNINKNIDVVLGYRDSQTKEWIAKKEKRRGQTYKTKRLIRTENGRIRNDANRDQWLNQQDIVPSKLQDVETLDSRVRQQSVSMDGDFSNAEGKFLYPDGKWHFLGRSGNPKWDVNERGTTINVDPEYPPESRIQRDPKTGKNKIVPFRNFKDYADEKGLVKNKYGQYLFGKPSKTKPSAVKPRAKSVRPKTPTRQTTPTRQRIRDVDVLSKDSENLLLKKSGYSMKLTDNIAEEFGVTRNRVLNVEAAYTRKYPRRKLNIDQLRALVVDDMGKEIERLKKALKR